MSAPSSHTTGSEPPILVSHELCPYVQRVAITLREKGVPFERVYVDLANKPEWFLRLSPLGKVPLLQVADAVIFESAVICNYVDEVYAPPLLPTDPLARADQRAWVEHASATLSNIAGLYNSADRDVLVAQRDALAAKFEWVERTLTKPWFSGEHFGLVDAAYAPVFRYLDAFETFSDLKLLRRAPAVQRWRERLANRPSVQGAVLDDFHERLVQFMHDRSSAFGQLARGELLLTT